MVQIQLKISNGFKQKFGDSRIRLTRCLTHFSNSASKYCVTRGYTKRSYIKIFSFAKGSNYLMFYITIESFVFRKMTRFTTNVLIRLVCTCVTVYSTYLISFISLVSLCCSARLMFFSFNFSFSLITLLTSFNLKHNLGWL